MTNSLFTHLYCPHCGAKYVKDQLQTFCTKNNCSNPLVAQYDLSKPLSKDILANRSNDMWRYSELLPIEEEQNKVSLGEGMTPLLALPKLAAKLNLHQLLVKDEAINPTGSFKARGLAMAISKAKELGVQACSIPTAGNAGSALSAYCARGGMKAFVFMPEKTPELFKKDCKLYGAELTVVDGNISDCGRLMKSQNEKGRWFDVSTLKEPYRLEGKKTMGLEIAEQLDWQLPDVIIYPTGGGTGLIGIWKAFKELKELGWVDHIPTRMVAVQVNGCDPIVDAFHNGQDYAEPYPDPAVTIANGLRVPFAFGHRLILQTLQESSGTAISITDEEMQDGLYEIAASEGLLVAPEGAAVWIALKKLMIQNWVKPHEQVVLLNTGSAYKYFENID